MIKYSVHENVIREYQMMKKAGFIERDGLSALDEDGVPREMISLHIQGNTYGIRAEELVRVITGTIMARIERIEHNWKASIGGYAGKVQVSKSGKALNIELTDGNRYTISLDSVHRVFVKRDRFAPIVEIPSVTSYIINKNHRITEFCEVTTYPRTLYEQGSQITA